MNKIHLLNTLKAVLVASAVALVACGGGGGGSGGDAPQGPPVLSIYAGSLPARGSDGIGAAAQFSSPRGVAQDASGTVYVADTSNQTIRKVTRQGAVTTLAGAVGQSGSADGTGAAARFSSPQGLAIDAAGNLYVTDTGNHTVRRISPAGVVTTVAGVAGQAGSTDGANGVARLDTPKKLALDGSGGVYVLSDTSVRKVAADGSISAFLPAGASSPAPVMRFSGIAVDGAGNAFIAQAPVSVFSTSAGAGVGTLRKFSAQGQPLPLGTAADGVLNVVFAVDLAVDPSGNLVAAQNGSTAITGISNTEAYYRNVLRIAPDGSVVVVAGGGKVFPQPLSRDGPAATASLADPVAVAVGPDGVVAVAEASTGKVRLVDPQGTVSTLAGGDGAGYVDGAAATARFEKPQGIAAAADGSLYVVDRQGRALLRKISPSGEVATVATLQDDPKNVAIGPDGAVYVSDLENARIFPTYNVRRIPLTPGSQLAPTAIPYISNRGRSFAFTVDAAGNFIAVRSVSTNVPPTFSVDQIVAIAPDGTERVLASGVTAAALTADRSGGVYFATTDGTVGAVSATGQVTIRAGVAGQLGDQDGTGVNASFRSPSAIAVDAAGNLYVGDGTRVRKVTPGGVVTTIADAGATIRGMTWIAGALYATAGNAVVKIAPVN